MEDVVIVVVGSSSSAGRSTDVWHRLKSLNPPGGVSGGGFIHR
jgi:hypothetical protein